MRRFPIDTFTMLLVGMALLAAFLPIGGVYADWFGVATNIAIGFLFFLHGARLSRTVALAGFLHWRLHLTILATTFVIFPILGLALGLIPDSILPHALYLGILFLTVLPSTVQSSIAFTSVAGGNVPAAICSASASNVLGMFLTPLLLTILPSAGGQPVSISASSAVGIFFQLLAPFLLGQLLEPWIGDWIRARKKMLNPVDRGSILMVVYLAFSHAVNEGIWQSFSLADIGVVCVADLALFGVVVAITTYGSRLLGFSREDEIAIVFCGSKKSLASGVPMANVMFPATQVGAIVLPLMLYHQMQLMICAQLAGWYARRKQAMVIAAEAEAAATAS